MFLELKENQEQEKAVLPGVGQNITTQKELNIVKRIIQSAGYDPQLVQLTDAVNYCNWLQ